MPAFPASRLLAMLKEAAIPPADVKAWRAAIEPLETLASNYVDGLEVHAHRTVVSLLQDYLAIEQLFQVTQPVATWSIKVPGEVDALTALSGLDAAGASRVYSTAGAAREEQGRSWPGCRYPYVSCTQRSVCPWSGRPPGADRTPPLVHHRPLPPHSSGALCPRRF